MTVKAQESLTVATFQVCSTDSLEQNYRKISKMIESIENIDEVDLCVFPENAIYISIDKNEKPPVIDFNHSFFAYIKNLAKSTNTAFHLGSLPIYKENKLFNSSLFCDANGELSFPYDKIHLFAAKVGSLEIDEGKSYESGVKPSIINIKGWRLGLSICFDLRFSELYSYYAKKGVELILVPSAFFRATGKVHWEPLLRARAIETQSYVVAPGQVGVHETSHEVGSSLRKSYGHSLVVDPWGEIIEDFGAEDEKVLIHKLELEKIKKVRDSIFMKRKM